MKPIDKCFSMPLSSLFQPPLLLNGSPRKVKRYPSPQICATAQVVPKDTVLHLSSSSHRRVSEHAVAAIRDLYVRANGAVHRGSCAHTLGRYAAELMEAARTDVALAIGAEHWKEIAFAPSAYAATTILAQSLGSTLRKGDQILLNYMESDHTIIPWRIAAKQRGFKLKFCRPDMSEGGEFVFEQFVSLVSSKTKLIVLQHACPIFGTFNPLVEFVDFAESCGIPVAVDATYSLPWSKLDLQKMRCDFLIADCQAIGAPHGSAFLYGLMDRLERLPPVLGGDDTFEEFSAGRLEVNVAKDPSNWAPIPERFEVALSSLAVGAGLAAALREYDRSMDSNMAAKCSELGLRLYSELKSCSSVHVYGTANLARIPIASFHVDGIDHAILADTLGKQQAFVDIGCHGASIAHNEELNMSSTLRVRFDPCRHDAEDVSRFVRILKNALRQLGVR